MKQRVLLALCLACIVATTVFMTCRVVSLTWRVERLEAAFKNAPQTPIVSEAPVGMPREVNAPPDGGHVEVLDVIDGNTVVAGTSTSHVKVRVIGIDTPETVHPDKAVEPFGPEATARARELLLGRTVCIQYDPDPAHDRWDKYGRLLAYVQLPDGRDFGQVIVEEGLGRAYTKFPFSRQVQYVQVEATARENAIGLWAAGAATIPPSN